MSIKTDNKTKLPTTGEDTIGPYYPIPFLDDDKQDLSRLHAGLCVMPQGEKICLQLRLLDSNGKPVEGALLEFWQANANGVLRTPINQNNQELDPYFDGYSRQRSTDGIFELLTIKPGCIKNETDDKQSRAPHITVNIFCDGITRVVTQIFFDDEPDNINDPLLLSLPTELRSRLVAKKCGLKNEVSLYQIDIVMKGENETPFFDDILS
ncbi:protocatechuate 3,4-dioxygenase subunit alpha [Aliikangiella sp. IMCC44359]|uniref:protocatechuate 3,4-dioxygenase subunit alpha n=1 Tax=Aliikangiella sp. IMCC44359 TaxID=3459125 RepID=UPI00403ACDF7